MTKLGKPVKSQVINVIEDIEEQSIDKNVIFGNFWATYSTLGCIREDKAQLGVWNCSMGVSFIDI